MWASCRTMLEMKRAVLLLSVVLLTYAAPMHQNEKELSSSVESEVASSDTQLTGGTSQTPRSDIIITAPAGFGRPNENGRSAVTISLRDENTNVSVNVMSFIFSTQDENAQSSEEWSNSNPVKEMQAKGPGPDVTNEKNNTNIAGEEREEGFDLTAVPKNDEELDESKEEAPAPTDYTSDEGLGEIDELSADIQAYQPIITSLQVPKTGEKSKISKSDTTSHRVDSDSEESDHLKVFGSSQSTISVTSSSENDSNQPDSGSDSQKTKVQTISDCTGYQSDSAEHSVLHYLLGELTGLRSVLSPLKPQPSKTNAFTDPLSILSNEETTSAEEKRKGTDPRSDLSSVEGQAVPTYSVPTLGPWTLQTSSPLSSSEEKKEDELETFVNDATPRKTISPISGLESMVNPLAVMKNEGSPTPFFFGSDFFPEYVNDEGQDVNFGYYDPYGNHPGYAAGYDPYGGGYDPYGRGYDPYAAGYDPYAAGYDPYRAGYDPYGQGYDPYGAGYDPYGAGYDPYGAGYEHPEVDPYHETESEDPRYDPVQENTPTYSLEGNESLPTMISNHQDNSDSEEQQQELTSVSPSVTPASLAEGSESVDSAHNHPSEEPSNSSSSETSREMAIRPSNGPNESTRDPDPAVSNSQEGTETRVKAEGKEMTPAVSSSSEESVETTDSDQQSQNTMNNHLDQPGNQEVPDPAVPTSSHISMVQVIQNIQEIFVSKIHGEEEPQSPSHVDLAPASSSEEDEPLSNTNDVGIMTHSPTIHGGSSEEGAVVSMNPDSTPSDNYISEKNNQNEESFSNESTTDNQEITAEVTPESTVNQESVEFTTESPTFDSESVPTSDSLVSNEEVSSEISTPNLSASLQIATQSSGGLVNSAEANANTNANESEESQESQIFTPSSVSSIASQPSHTQHTENSSEEENTRDKKSGQVMISHFRVATPPVRTAANLWTAFLQALRVPVPNRSVQHVKKNSRRPLSDRRHQRHSNKRQKAISSEESE